MKHVLFLCTGNACRSQMAEGLWRHLAGTGWEAASAGSRPTGEVHPLAIRVMAEIGIDLSGAASETLARYRGRTFDLVITVCDRARASCPVFPGATATHHWPFDDPADATGPVDARIHAFRRVRDQIADRIRAFLASASEANR